MTGADLPDAEAGWIVGEQEGADVDVYALRGREGGAALERTDVPNLRAHTGKDGGGQHQLIHDKREAPETAATLTSAGNAKSKPNRRKEDDVNLVAEGFDAYNQQSTGDVSGSLVVGTHGAGPHQQLVDDRREAEAYHAYHGYQQPDEGVQTLTGGASGGMLSLHDGPIIREEQPDTATGLTASYRKGADSDATDALVTGTEPSCVHADAVGRDGIAREDSPDAEGRMRKRDAGLGVRDDGQAYNLTTGAPHAVGPVPFVKRASARSDTDDETWEQGETARTLNGMGQAGTNGAIAVEGAEAFLPRHFTRGKDGAPSDQVPPLTKESDRGDGMAMVHQPAEPVAFAQNQREELRELDAASSLSAQPGTHQETRIAQRATVRRLTPTECERLQGFPDGWTIPLPPALGDGEARDTSLANAPSHYHRSSVPPWERGGLADAFQPGPTEQAGQTAYRLTGEYADPSLVRDDNPMLTANPMSDRVPFVGPEPEQVGDLSPALTSSPGFAAGCGHSNGDDATIAASAALQRAGEPEVHATIRTDNTGSGGDPIRHDGQTESLTKASPPAVAYNVRPASGDGASATANETDTAEAIVAAQGRKTGSGTVVDEPAVAYDDRNQATAEDLHHTLRADGGLKSSDHVMVSEPRTVDLSSQHGSGETGTGVPNMSAPGESLAVTTRSDRMAVFGDTSGGIDEPFDPKPDGPRYAAMGDAVTVPVISWIGRRVLLCHLERHPDTGDHLDYRRHDG